MTVPGPGRVASNTVLVIAVILTVCIGLPILGCLGLAACGAIGGGH